MKFEDLKLIQQITILSNMMETPDTSKTKEENIHRIPDTNYVIDVMDVYTSTSAYIPVSSGEDGDIDVDFSSVYPSDEGEDSVSLDFVMVRNHEENSSIDKFGLLAGLILSGDLVTGLKKIISILGTLSKLGFVKGNPSEVLKRMLELIPIAKTLPTEIFERVYIDPIGAKVVRVIHESVNTVILKSGPDYLKDEISINDYYYGHIIEHENRNTDNDSQNLRLTVGYGAFGLNNVISFRVSNLSLIHISEPTRPY